MFVPQAMRQRLLVELWHRLLHRAGRQWPQGLAMPTKGELNALFQNRAAIGGFNETGLYPGAYYWSSSPYYSYGAWTQRFDSGYQSYGNVYGDSSLRCVG